MKAGFFREHGGVEKVEYGEVPTPTPRANEVLVRVHAAALNHLDLFVLEGMPGLKLEFPHWGGCDIAGEIVELGAGVQGWKVGQHVVVNPDLWCGECEYCQAGEESCCVQFQVFGEHTRGGFAEYVAVPTANLFLIPDEYSWTQAAAVPLVYLTAWRAVMGQGQFKSGQSILILGASGGVATAAIQIAKLEGGVVYAASRSAEKRAQAKALGADFVLDTNEDFSKELWSLTNKLGVDLVIENVGSATWARSLRAVKKGGRVVTFGATSGPMVEIDLRQLFWKQYAMIGSTMANLREASTVLHHVFWNNHLKPVVDRVFPLSQIQDAYRHLEGAEQFGKVVIVPDSVQQ